MGVFSADEIFKPDIYQIGTPDNGLTVAEMGENDNPKPGMGLWRVN